MAGKQRRVMPASYLPVGCLISTASYLPVRPTSTARGTKTG